MFSKQCLRRQGLPDDIAGAVSFLLGPDSAFITGQTLCVDGGWGVPLGNSRHTGRQQHPELRLLERIQRRPAGLVVAAFDAHSCDALGVDESAPGLAKRSFRRCFPTSLPGSCRDLRTCGAKSCRARSACVRGLTVAGLVVGYIRLERSCAPRPPSVPSSSTLPWAAYP